MKRREFLIRAGVTGMVVPTLGRPTTPCPPPTTAVAGGSSTSTTCVASVDAMADWTTRISGPGVVWYNGFQSDAEMNLFRWAGGIGNDPNSTDSTAANVTRPLTGGPGNFPYLNLFRAAGSKETNTVWWRPFSPMTAATNGKGVNDPAASGTIALTSWTPATGSNTLAGWTKGWYSNNPALSPDGVDFWVQLRVKMDPNASASGAISPAKLFELNLASATFTNQTLVTYLNGSYRSGTNYNRIYSGDGGGIWDYQDNGYATSDNISGGDPRTTSLPAYSEQIGGATFNPPTSLCNVSNGASGEGTAAACWAYSGGWDTLLYHVTPGPAVGSGPHGGVVCSIQVYAAHQGETTYTKIRDQSYELNGWNGAGQEGYQALYLATYSNNEAQPVAINSKFAQIIFSKQFIPCPLA